jgi:hypothetical protein
MKKQNVTKGTWTCQIKMAVPQHILVTFAMIDADLVGCNF